MAEFVERSMEEMVPEFEEMFATEMFTDQQIKTIMRKRREMEYRLVRRVKVKEDYFEYIQYEVDLLAMVEIRRTQLEHHKVDIESAIRHRIHKLFGIMEHRFPSDVSVWLHHIEYCVQIDEDYACLPIYEKLLKLHPKRVDLWIAFAKCALDCNDIEKSRSVFWKALRIHSSSFPVWLEYFRMELLAAYQLRKEEMLKSVDRDDEEGGSDGDINFEKFSDGKHDYSAAFVVFKSALEQNFDVSKYVEFLEISDLFDFTSQMSDDILNLLNKFSKNEYVLDFEAHRPLFKLEKRLLKNDYPDMARAEMTSQCEKTCWKNYENCIEALPTKKMWLFYLEFLMRNIIKRPADSPSHQQLKKAFDMFERASRLFLLPEEVIVSWSNLVSRTTNWSNGVDLCLYAIDKDAQLKQKSSIWKHILMLHSDDNRYQVDRMKILAEAVESVCEEECAEIDRLAVMLTSQLQLHKMTMSYFEKAMKRRKIDESLMIECLQWTCTVTGDISSVRGLYMALSPLLTSNEKFLISYLQLEMDQPAPDNSKIQEIFEMCVTKFGKENTSIWLKFIEFEMQNKSISISSLHERARRSLKADLFEIFSEKYLKLAAS